MDQISILVERAKKLAHQRGQSLSTISRKLLNDGKGIARLENGGQCTLKTLGKAFKNLESMDREILSKATDAQLPIQSVLSKPYLSHLDRLEAQSLFIMREAFATCANPVLLYSAGKDSAVMLHLALKAFYPASLPFPLLHVDTGWKFKEMISFRDKRVEELGLTLHVHTNIEGAAQNIDPFVRGGLHTDIMKTQGLKQALDKFGFDAAFGGARRDEDVSRAKERVFSLRSTGHRWSPKNQRPELWNDYNTRILKGESLRIFPLSDWTELDIWEYIYKENIEIPCLYFAKPRQVVQREECLLLKDDDRFPLTKTDVVQEKNVRFRTLGCYPLTGAHLSSATSVSEIINELLQKDRSERSGRTDDGFGENSLEMKKTKGYF